MNIIIEMTFGSHLYGTNTPESDLDIKGIFLPTSREIVLGRYKKTVNISRSKNEKERNTNTDTDREFFSLDQYLKHLCDGQTLALDMLFAPEEMYINKTWTVDGVNILRMLRLNKDKLLNKNVNAFVGYAKQQSARYGVKGSRMDALKQTLELLDNFSDYDRLGDHWDLISELVEKSKNLISLEKTPLIRIVDLPTGDKKTLLPHLEVANRKLSHTIKIKMAKDILKRIYDEYGTRSTKAHLSGGKDYKALSHCVRVSAEAKELLETGHITFPRPEKELLLKIKLQQIPYEEISEIIEQGLADMTEAALKSTLRSEPDRQWADDFVEEIYTGIVKDNY